MRRTFWLFETVTQGDATSRAWQFAQRLRNTADEELVVPLETSVAAPHREPDFAEDFFLMRLNAEITGTCGREPTDYRGSCVRSSPRDGVTPNV